MSLYERIFGKKIDSIPQSIAQAPSTPMPVLTEINDMDEDSQATEIFRRDIKSDITHLNELIERYNKIHDRAGKLSQLREIRLYQKKMDEKYPPDDMACTPDYQTQIHEVLFNAVKQEYSNLGVKSLPVESFSGRPVISQQTTPRSVDALSVMIANMSPQKASQLLKIITSNSAENACVKMKTLYSKGEHGYEDYVEFFKRHKIEYLGGGNSRNFRIISLTDNSILILKMDNRLNTPKAAESQLREGVLSDVFTQVSTERQVTCTPDWQSPITRTLLTTEYCDGSDLEAYAKKDSNKTTSAFDIFSQMGQILEKTRKAGFAWTDSKNSNWVMDKGKLRISDTKAFLPAKNGIFSKTTARLEGYPILASGHMMWPEANIPDSSVDKMNSYLMGRNLYQYLTGCDDAYLTRAYDVDDYLFNQNCGFDFTTENGMFFKQLIEKMVTSTAANRISVEEALFELDRQPLKEPINKANALLTEISSNREIDFELNCFIVEKQSQINRATTADALADINQDLQKELNRLILKVPVKETTSLLEKIELHKFGKTDLKMDEFIKMNKDEINKATTTEELTTIKEKLEGILSNLESKPINEIKTIIESFRDKARFYTIGMKTKADKIEQAMSGEMQSMDVEKRQNWRPVMTQAPSTQPTDLQKSLASNRHIYGLKLYTNQDGSINEKKSANSFKKLQKTVTNTSQEETHESSQNSPTITPRG